MYVSGQRIEAEQQQKAADKAEGVKRMGLSPAALKRRLAAKKAAAKAAKAVVE